MGFSISGSGCRCRATARRKRGNSGRDAPGRWRRGVRREGLTGAAADDKKRSSVPLRCYNPGMVKALNIPPSRRRSAQTGPLVRGTPRLCRQLPVGGQQDDVCEGAGRLDDRDHRGQQRARRAGDEGRRVAAPGDRVTDFDAVYERLKGKGVSFLTQPRRRTGPHWCSSPTATATFSICCNGKSAAIGGRGIVTWASR